MQVMYAVLNVYLLSHQNRGVDYHSIGGISRFCAALGLGCLALLSACSGSSPVESFEAGVPDVSANAPDQEALTRIPEILLQLEDEPGLLAGIPDVYASQTLADSGLQVAYTQPEQIQAIPALVIETQWLYMQSCLEQVAAAPVVVVQAGPVTPFTPEDDVIHSIEGIPIASASTRLSVVIQVRDTDFDGSLGEPGFNLRSIMGRYLWLAANLPERDYPFYCAQQQP